MAHVAFLRLGDALVLQRAFVAEQVLPLAVAILAHRDVERRVAAHRHAAVHARDLFLGDAEVGRDLGEMFGRRSEEHTSELQSLMRTSYAVFCLKKKKRKTYI